MHVDEICYFSRMGSLFVGRSSVIVHEQCTNITHVLEVRFAIAAASNLLDVLLLFKIINNIKRNNTITVEFVHACCMTVPGNRV